MTTPAEGAVLAMPSALSTSLGQQPVVVSNLAGVLPAIALIAFLFGCFALLVRMVRTAEPSPIAVGVTAVLALGALSLSTFTLTALRQELAFGAWLLVVTLTAAAPLLGVGLVRLNQRNATAVTIAVLTVVVLVLASTPLGGSRQWGLSLGLAAFHVGVCLPPLVLAGAVIDGWWTTRRSFRLPWSVYR